MSVIVSTNKLGTMTYSHESKIMFVEFRGIVEPELAMEHFNSILEFASSNQIIGILADLTRLRGSYIKFFDFFQENAYPQLIKGGLKAHSTSVSDDLIIENISLKLKDLHKVMGIESRVFLDDEKAQRWLEAKLKS